MNVFERFVNSVKTCTMPAPPFYGWFHILWLCVMVTVCVILCVFRGRISQRAVRITLIVWGSLLIASEVLKQLVCSFNPVDGKAEWKYAWWTFPYQFCSTPLYVALPAGILKKGKLKDALQSFLALFAIVGGLAAMFCPTGMFTDIVFINLHTMLWHTSMVSVSVLLLATHTVKLDFYSLLKGFIVYIILTAIAFILNIIWGRQTGFNLFFISPYQEKSSAIYSVLRYAMPYPVFLIGYIAVFVLAPTLILLASMLGEKLLDKRKKI